MKVKTTTIVSSICFVYAKFVFNEFDQLCTLTHRKSSLGFKWKYALFGVQKSSKNEKPNVLNEVFWRHDYDVDSRTVRATALQLGTKRVTVFVASLCKSEWDKFCRFACETNQMFYAHMHTHSDSHRTHKHKLTHRAIWTSMLRVNPMIWNRRNVNFGLLLLKLWTMLFIQHG